MKKNLFIAFLLCFALSSFAWAGVLFPPENNPNGDGACPTGQMVRWNGNGLECSDEVSLSETCPSGYVMKGINKGTPICEKLPNSISTMQVSCSTRLKSGSSRSVSCVASCPKGTTVTGGGFSFGAVYSDKGRSSFKSGNGWYCGINVSSCSSGSFANGCNSKCYALCAKIY